MQQSVPASFSVRSEHPTENGDPSTYNTKKAGLTNYTLTKTKMEHSYAKNGFVPFASPGGEYFAKRTEGTISSSWIPLARIRTLDCDNFKIEWHPPSVESIDIDKENVLARFRAEDLKTQPECI